MKFFKDENDVVYAFASDGSQDQFIGHGLIRISEQEAHALANPPPSTEQLIAFAEAKKNELFKLSSFEIACLEDAVELNIASTEDKNRLVEWRKYRLWVGRLDTSKPEDIRWENTPE